MNSPERFSIECVEDFIYLITDEYNFGTGISKRTRLIDTRSSPEEEIIIKALIDNYNALFKMRTIE